jgi:TRAP-type uncharacterized transport system substrate-binding protein
MRTSVMWLVLLTSFSLSQVSEMAWAQTRSKVVKNTSFESDVRMRKNQWTVGLAGGQYTGTYMRFADEIALALDEPDKMRVLPIVSYGAVSNLEDLLYLSNVDVAVTQSDVFEYFRTEKKVPNLEGRVHYIVRLPVSELHILATEDHKTIQDLRGKRVSFGPAGSGSSLTGKIVFERLGVQVDPVLVDNAQALQKLRSGEIAALVRVVNKPVEFFTKIPDNSGLHLLPVPYSKVFADYYTVGDFTSKEYPTLVRSGERVETIAVPAVLAAFNWKPGTDRYRRIERFVERFFINLEKMQKPPFHPKWRDVNLSATVPGWQRLVVAEQMLAKVSVADAARRRDLAREFELFLSRAGQSDLAQSREQLFEEFIQWQRIRGAGAR